MFSIVLVTFISLLSIFWFFSRRNRKAKFNVPGVPSSDPKLGNLADIGKAGSLHQYLTKLHKKFGPVVSFYWGKERVVSIASPEAFHETRRLFDRPVSLFNPFEAFLGPNSIMFADGEVAQYRRKNHYDAPLSLVALRGHLFGKFEDVLRQKLVQWHSYGGKSIGLHHEMKAIAVRSIIVAALGSSSVDGEEKTIEEAFNTCWYEMEMRIQGHPTDAKREEEFNKARSYFRQKVKAIIAERRRRSGEDEKCFLDYLLADEENVLTEEHISDEVTSIFLGGLHTTGSLLTWVLYYLAKHQDVQQRLFEELVQTYDTELPSFEKIDQLSYLTCVINETLRVSVLAPSSERISATEELVVCGRTIPAGTPIVQSLGIVLHDENIWSNPEEFDPDRFNAENKKKLPALAFSPFGFAGKRMCPGYRFAHYETSLFIAGIVRAFQVTLVDPTSPVVPFHGLATVPKHEIFAHFTPRDAPTC